MFSPTKCGLYSIHQKFLHLLIHTAEFKEVYTKAENDGLFEEQVSARDLYGAMMKTLAQTGNGWMTFKDASNEKANQVGINKENVIHLSNLCTEIIEVTSGKETAVCNLGSINLSKYVDGDDIDYEKLGKMLKSLLNI